MRLALAAVVVVVALAGTLTATAAQTTAPRHGSAITAPPYTPPDECLAQHFDEYAEAVWDIDLWRRGGAAGRAISTLRYRLSCAPSAAHRRAMKRKWAKARLAYGIYRNYRLITPFDGPCNGSPPGPADGCHWAIPWQIVCGESGGDFYVNADGAYQIIPSTWASAGGLAYAVTAGGASPMEQHIVAHRLWGTTAWYGLC